MRQQVRALLEIWGGSVDPITKLKNLEERARQRSQERQGQDSMTASTHVAGAIDKVVRLPLWPEPVRACPSCVLRSALFGVVQRGRRKALERLILASWEGVTIRYTGWRLDQADLDVWLTILHLAQRYALGMHVPVTIRGILKTMEHCTGKHDHEWFKGAVARLTACAVEITVGRKTYGGPLIEGFERNELTGEYVLNLNARLAVLFEDNAFTRIDWEQRRSLTMDLAKWLHSYILSHQATTNNPHRIGLGRLRELCGSETGELWRFRQQIREAMQALHTAGVVATWRITTGDALEIVRPPRKRQLIENHPTG